MKTKRYIIEVSALGYETTTLTVPAKTLAKARSFKRGALVMWCKVNDVGWDSVGLTTISYRLSSS